MLLRRQRPGAGRGGDGEWRCSGRDGQGPGPGRERRPRARSEPPRPLARKQQAASRVTTATERARPQHCKHPHALPVKSHALLPPAPSPEAQLAPVTRKPYGSPGTPCTTTPRVTPAGRAIGCPHRRRHFVAAARIGAAPHVILPSSGDAAASGGRAGANAALPAGRCQLACREPRRPSVRPSPSAAAVAGSFRRRRRREPSPSRFTEVGRGRSDHRVQPLT